jgi:2-polyprenyl-3-methyl-5-hydroxy-6-metoxy-1,4-benzoquinol methylase
MTPYSEKIKEFMKINQKRWDELVDIHKESRFYNLSAFLGGKSSLLPFEERELPNLYGKKVLHLMCHFGLDSLSLARKGAIVTGVDFSKKAIDLGQDLSDKLDLNAKFIQANVYDLPQILDEKYDIVFTSYGILAWLPDLKEWAKVISHFLKPGGEFYFFEIHPFTTMLELNDKDELYIAYPYQSDPDEPEIIDEPGTYTDGAVRSTNITHQKRYEWFHSFQTIISSLAESGLKIEYVHEFSEGIFQMLSNMEPIGNGLYGFSDPKLKIPLTFSLKARKL